MNRRPRGRDGRGGCIVQRWGQRSNTLLRTRLGNGSWPNPDIPRPRLAFRNSEALLHAGSMARQLVLTIVVLPTILQPFSKQREPGLASCMRRQRAATTCAAFSRLVLLSMATGREEPQGSPVPHRYANFRFSRHPSIGVGGIGLRTENEANHGSSNSCSF